MVYAYSEKLLTDNLINFVKKEAAAIHRMP